LISRNLAGERIGLPSFCTANEHVIRTILDQAVGRNVPDLIEATCNQVNQEGGYTGMNPADFANWLAQLSDSAGVQNGQLLLGGDHLGPNPWRNEPVDRAVAKAEVLVRDYVKAGFTKIHLVASMACGGEPLPSFSEVAERAARLCRVAEENAPDPSALIYVIGTEVPVPGGETHDKSGLQLTTPERLDETISSHRDFFRDAGVAQAWKRVVSVVTQPGVDFSHSSVHRFDAAAANDLVAAIGPFDGLTFEGHSTDYQPTSSLAELVDRHVIFLKVGPELTFRFREAIFALAEIEDRLCPDARSGIVDVLDAAMDRTPGHWSGYYGGPKQDVAVLRHFSLSDRIRYYWQDPEVSAALNRMMENLSRRALPSGLVTQFFGEHEFGEIPVGPYELCAERVARSVKRYFAACGFSLD
jgi:D-tagatose-1,6-bisphosphate aldolase subunit GatZ/KbaZ